MFDRWFPWIDGDPIRQPDDCSENACRAQSDHGKQKRQPS